MIIRLTGGLGNQLFQYAFGRKLSIVKNEILMFDDFSYLRDRKRKNEINAFELNMQHTSVFDTLRFNYHFYIHEKFGKNCKLMFCEEVPFAYLEDLKDKNLKYYCGCWLNSNYFNDIKNELEKSFWPVNVSRRIIEEGKKIEFENSVMLHVRRGDYLNTAGYVVLGTGYFAMALDYIFCNIANPTFYIFSDDIEWCKNALPICFSERGLITEINYMEGNNTMEDFYLMRKCKHFIISNSTFSWWPAYLGNDEYSLKIAPRNWFESSLLNDRINDGLLGEFYTL